MDKYYDYRVTLLRGNISIDVYVSLPAEDLVLVENSGGFYDLHSDSFDFVVDYAAHHLNEETGAQLWVRNWDYEIEQLS
jgi:hypothetical protein